MDKNQLRIKECPCAPNLTVQDLLNYFILQNMEGKNMCKNMPSAKHRDKAGENRCKDGIAHKKSLN